MKKWPVKQLGDLADQSGGEIRTGPFGSQLHRHDYIIGDDGVPVVMPLNMSRGRIDLTGIERISRAKASELSAHITRPGDVLLARRGDIGRYCLIDGVSAGALCGTGSLRISIQGSELLPEYLALFLETPAGRHELQGKAVGATMLNINANIVRSFTLPVPPTATQRKIVGLLAAYEKLTDNNRHRSDVLQEIVRRTYRDWFVSAGGSGTVNSLSGAGPWDVMELSKLAEVITRGISPRYSEESESLVVNQRCIRDQTLDLSHARRHTTSVPEAKLLREGDILINSTGVGTLGRVAQVMFTPKDLTVDSHVTIVRPAQAIASVDFLGLALLEKEEEIAGLGIGSTGQTELGRNIVGRIALSVPPLPMQLEFARLVHPMRQLPIALTNASMYLSDSREMLLPKLVSGEVDVEELDILLPKEAA